METILMTGVTGFLGSHIARKLSLEGRHCIVALKRTNSDLSRCFDFADKIIWINLDQEWEQEVLLQKPSIIIHSAWIGVESKDRDLWDSQIKNIEFSHKLLKIGELCGIYKFIGLGSFAEYGDFDDKVQEDYAVNPTTAYGAVKVASQQIVKSFCEMKGIKWYWLRLFSFFGEGEGEHWLIPSVITSILLNRELKLTKGEQKYAYLHVDDLARCLWDVVNTTAPSGIYNVSAEEVVSLETIVTKIRDLINPQFRLNFGSLPYRVNQQMMVAGNVGKYCSSIGPIYSSPLDDMLRKTILYYTDKIKRDESL